MTLNTLPVSYCTNVHPGRTVDEVIQGLTDTTGPVRRALDVPIAAGLWLARSVTEELEQDSSALERLAQTLWQNDLACYTLNAFPYGNFHDTRVKEQVYLPDWTTRDRSAYTEACARLLAKLLPEGAEGSISTLPLGGRMNPHGADFHAVCYSNLIRFAKYLEQLEKETGRCIRLAVEPEPMCELSSVPELVLPVFRRLFAQADAVNAGDTVRRYIGLCLDVCHQAVEFEDLTESVQSIEAAGIRINKVHLTNAIELTSPGTNAAGRHALRQYAEPRYLHQTSARMPNGELLWWPDLETEVLQDENDSPLMEAEAWRVHFHVPLSVESLGPLGCTRRELQDAVNAIAALPYAPHLEIETYTWPVLPDGTELNLVAGIADEFTSAFEILSKADEN